MAFPGPRAYYLDLAQWYRDSDLEKQSPLDHSIRQAFDCARAGVLPTLNHFLLMSMPVRMVVTTNYDHLLERALRALRRYPITVVEDAEVPQTGRLDGVSVVKFHGDALRGQNIVLSRDDYDSFFQRRPAMAALLEGLLLNQTFFFVGYSLRDPDFRQIHHRVATMLMDAKRPAYATTFDVESPHLVKQWQRKCLMLLPVPGVDAAEKSRRLTRFLDSLAESVAGEQRLFLAPDTHPEDAPANPAVSRMRRKLQELGLIVEEIASAEGSQAQLTAAETHQVEWVLRFMTEHGWRPDATSLSRVWTALAGRTTDPEERQRQLVTALVHTESLREARSILQRLDTLLPDRLREAEDLAAIREGIAQADRGEGRPAEEFSGELMKGRGIQSRDHP